MQSHQEYSPAFLDFFMERVKEYLDQSEMFFHLPYSIDTFFDSYDDITIREYSDIQSELHDFEIGLFEYLDGLTVNLNYFLYLEDELPDIIKALDGRVGKTNNIRARILHNPDDMEDEVERAIEVAFEYLDKIRAHYTEETIEACLEETQSCPYMKYYAGELRYTEREDIYDRMEYLFWDEFGHPLNLYDMSDEFENWLTDEIHDPDNMVDQIEDVLTGKASKKFPNAFDLMEKFSQADIATAVEVIAENNKLSDKKVLEDNKAKASKSALDSKDKGPKLYTEVSPNVFQMKRPTPSPDG